MPPKWIIDDDYITRLEIVAVPDHRFGSRLHDSQEDGQPQLPLGDDLAGPAIVDAVGSVEGFGDDG